MKRTVKLCVLGVLLSVSACSEDPAPSKNNGMGGEDLGEDSGMDLGMDLVADQPSDVPDEGVVDAGPDAAQDMCIAATQCAPGQCGKVSDGCGGELMCTPCLCVDGVAQVPSCGLCELGQVDCSRADGQPACVQPVLPAGFNLDCAKLVYFDPQAVEAGSGSRAEPYNDLERALQRANELQGGAILWGGDGSLVRDLMLVQEVVLPAGVSIIGGFDSDWKYDINQRPTLYVEPQTANTSGMLVRNASAPTLLSNIRIEVADSMFAGDTAHGVRVVNSPGLVLHRVEVMVGKGGNGAAGAPGEPGEPGRNGTKGVSGREGSQTPYMNTGTNGQGGARCIATQPINGELLRGGRGGQGGIWSVTAGQEQPGRSGEPGDGNTIVLGVGATSRSAPAGGDGRPGVALMQPAAPGEPGEPMTQVMGERLTMSGGGMKGSPGTYGMSGGGGGGAMWCTSSPLVPAAQRCAGNYHGPSGGGGGGGGCGGTGGEGGQNGGGSVGLLLVNSPGVRLLETRVETRGGGAGGRGGEGGVGGEGGAGGLGTNEVDRAAGGPIMLPYKSGDGGAGARGQRGGAGGAGAGGVSVAVWCEGTRLVIEEGNALIPGPGGVGGAKVSSNDVEGVSGMSVTTVGCD